MVQLKSSNTFRSEKRESLKRPSVAFSDGLAGAIPELKQSKSRRKSGGSLTRKQSIKRVEISEIGEYLAPRTLIEGSPEYESLLKLEPKNLC